MSISKKPHRSELPLTKVRQLYGRRFRMQSLSDKTIYNGWIREVSPPNLRVHLSKVFRESVGTYLHFEASGKSHQMQFLALCVRLEGDRPVIQIVSEIVDFPLDSESRILIQGISATVVNDGDHHGLTVVDASDFGLGGFVAQKFQIGDGLEAVIETNQGQIQCLCQVRHCRATKLRSDIYRVGLKILHIDRISQARWRLILRASDSEVGIERLKAA